MVPIKGLFGSIVVWITGKTRRNLHWIFVHRLIGDIYGRAKVAQKRVKKRNKLTL